MEDSVYNTEVYYQSIYISCENNSKTIRSKKKKTTCFPILFDITNSKSNSDKVHVLVSLLLLLLGEKQTKDQIDKYI